MSLFHFTTTTGKIKDEFPLAQKQLTELEERVWKLEHPPRFKVGEKVKRKKKLGIVTGVNIMSMWTRHWNYEVLIGGEKRI